MKAEKLDPRLMNGTDGTEGTVVETTDPIQYQLYADWLAEDIRDKVQRLRTPHGEDRNALCARHDLAHRLSAALQWGEADKETFEGTFADGVVRRSLVLGGALKCQRIGLRVCAEENLTLEEVLTIQQSLPPIPPMEHEDRFSV